MEKSKAIELLKLAVPIKALTQQEYADFVEAVNMGMDALEQPTSPDTIDRKAALDALRRCQTYLYDARDPELKIKLSSAKAAINNLPTIQPEKAQLSQEGTTSDFPEPTRIISETRAIPSDDDCVSLSEKVTATFYDDEYEEWLQKTVTVRDVLDAVCDEYTVLPTIQPEPTDIDAREAVYNLAEKIGIHQLFALTVELRGEPIQPEPQWIPVSERLPEEPGYYITSNEYNGVGEDFYYDGHFWNADKNAYEVLAWMPKPEHYKPNK